MVSKVHYEQQSTFIEGLSSEVDENVDISEHIALFDKFLAFPNIEIQERASLAVQTLKLASDNVLLKTIYGLHDGKQP